MFISGLKQDHSLLAKRTKMEGEMFIPDLINLANQLSHTLEESAKTETAKILYLQPEQMKPPKLNQVLLVSAVITRSQVIGKEIVTNKHLSAFRPQSKLLILNDRDLRNYRALPSPSS